MDKKLEINIDSWAQKIGLSYEKIKSEDFKEYKSLFNFFDLNSDGVIDSDEIVNISEMKITPYAFKNLDDTRKKADSIFDMKEAQQFIEANKDKSGKTLAELGVTVSDLFNFMGMVYKKFVKENDLSSEQEKIIKDLSNIPERKEQQFSEEECEQLAQLTGDELQEARKYFYIEGRNTQLSANEIIFLVRDYKKKYNISKEHLARFDEFVNLKGKNGQEINSYDIMNILSFDSDEDIDKALTLLKQTERKYDSILVSNILFTVKSGSSYLYNYILNNPDAELTVQENRTTVNRDIREIKADGKILRFISGMELPEEVTYENNGTQTTERIYNPNINQIQFVTFDNSDFVHNNPTKIETQHLDKNGNIEYTEFYENGEIAGTQNVYIIDKNGIRTDIQTSSVDKETGVQKFIKHFSDTNGIKTDFELTTNPITNEYELSYQITNPTEEPSVIYVKNQSLKLIDEKTFLYTNNDKTYNISISNDNMMSITDNSTQKTYQIDLNKLFPNEKDKFIANRFVKMPAEMLVFLSEHPLDSITYGNYGKDDNGHFDKHLNLIEFGTQKKTKTDIELEDTVFSILMHEFGHCLDNKIGDVINSLSTNEEFIQCFKEEVDNFKQKHTSEEQNFVGYFTGATTMEGISRGCQEVVAETNMLTNTTSKEATAGRAYLLQRFFPKTIAFIAKLIQERL